MNRLTRRHRDGFYLMNDGVTVHRVIDKLGEYEDLELSPDEVVYLAKFFKDQTSTDSIKANLIMVEKLAQLSKYQDLEEAGRLIDWRKTSEEKPDSTRHLIVAYGEIISHYGYYLKPKDKWYKTWECKEEIAEPMYWTDMPAPPKESLHSDCCGKMDEVKND